MAKHAELVSLMVIIYHNLFLTGLFLGWFLAIFSDAFCNVQNLTVCGPPRATQDHVPVTSRIVQPKQMYGHNLKQNLVTCMASGTFVENCYGPIQTTRSCPKTVSIAFYSLVFPWVFRLPQPDAVAAKLSTSRKSTASVGSRLASGWTPTTFAPCVDQSQFPP